ncbi:MAG: hypothetical protein MUE73_14825 [Planctomycetes bacterium]|jgi:hypothetical protein|nr:hypothetical protein [Planctomycetota bacterium]
MNRTFLAGLAFAVAALAFFAGRHLAPAPAKSPDGGSAPGSPGAAAREEKLAELTAALSKAERERTVEAAARTAAEKEIARLTAELSVARGAEAPAGSAEARATGPRFAVEGLEEVLAAFDWKTCGEAVRRMAPLLVDLAVALRDGKPIPPSVGDVQRWNGTLVKEVLALQDKGVPGTGVNGMFTHPGIQGNLVWAALADADLPLSEAQTSALEALVTRYSEEDRRRLAGYGEDTLALRKLLEEADLKDRFYADVDRLVTDEQREALHPAAMRGRLQVDLFSSGILWATVARPIFYSDRAGLETAFLQSAKQSLPFSEEEAPILGQLAAGWAASLPEEYVAEPADPLSQQMMIPVSRVRTAAKAQLSAMEDALGRLPPGSKAVEEMREANVVMVPLRK